MSIEQDVIAYQTTRDDRAFNRVWKTFHGDVVRCAWRFRRRYAPVLTDMEYEDLISHGAEGLMRAVAQWDEKKGIPFYVYARMCIRNVNLNYLDYRRRRLFGGEPLTDYELPTTIELRLDIEEAVAKLPEKRKAAFVQHYLEGRSYEEAGLYSTYGCHARKMLRKVLADYRA